MAEPKRITEDLSAIPQPGKDELRAHAARGFRTLINNRPDGEEPGQPSAREMQAAAEAAGMRYVHLPVRVGAITAADVEAFRRALAESPKPALAYCKSGTRSYLLWGAGEALHAGRDPQEIVAQGAADGFDLKSLPPLVERLDENS